MQESTTPLLVEVDPTSNVTDLVIRNAVNRPTRVVYRRERDGGWHDVTARQFADECAALAKGLVAAGVEPGDRVAIMSRTRYEWTLADVAIWFAGAVTVPIYETSSVDQVAWILEDSGARMAFAENEAANRTILEAASTPPTVWQFDKDDVASLVTAGAGVSDEEIERRRQLAGLDDLATIIYTSGTTGRPKGCELTHGNFAVLTENSSKRLHSIVGVPEASTLLFLPLAHVFARFIQVLCISCGATLSHCPNPRELVDKLGQVQPTFLLSVPRVFEKVYNSAEQKAAAAGRGGLFAKAAATAIDYSKSLDTGGPGLGLKLRYALFNRLVYPKLRGVLGGKAQYAVSGGAPLGERLGHFYRGIGLVVLEGYGLTETTAPACVSVPERPKIGTVGPQLPGNSVRIDDNGEILLKGPHVFRGYHNNPQATAEAFVDGWFRTGDLGTLDADGYLSITGRSKEILVTAGGKNVAPAVLEDPLRAHPLVSQCIVVGDAKPFIAALLTLDTEMLPSWLANNNLPPMDAAAAATHPAVLAALQGAVDDANRSVSKAESIRKFDVLTEDFTIESGHLTPSMKLKRTQVLGDYAEAVERLYS